MKEVAKLWMDENMEHCESNKISADSLLRVIAAARIAPTVRTLHSCVRVCIHPRWWTVEMTFWLRMEWSRCQDCKGWNLSWGGYRAARNVRTRLHTFQTSWRRTTPKSPYIRNRMLAQISLVEHANPSAYVVQKCVNHLGVYITSLLVYYSLQLHGLCRSNQMRSHMSSSRCHSCLSCSLLSTQGSVKWV